MQSNSRPQFESSLPILNGGLCNGFTH